MKGLYVNVDPKSYLGEWQGKYTTGKSYKIDVLRINGFRARVNIKVATPSMSPTF
jgi:hypothetical protein